MLFRKTHGKDSTLWSPDAMNELIGKDHDVGKLNGKGEEGSSR